MPRRAPATRTATRTSSLRAAALLTLGALALHELRYLIDPGAASTAWAGGHAYLSAVAPLAIVVALSLVVVTLLGPLAAARGSRLGSRGGDRTGAYALALLLVHLGQEAGEGIAAGSPVAALAVSLLAAAAFAIPLALALGVLTAAVAGWLDRTAVTIAAGLHRRRFAVARRGPIAPADLRVISRLDLASATGRGPPSALPARV